MKIYTEKVKSNFEGTVIDLETIGDFDRGYNDSRQYRNITPIIFGYICNKKIEIMCAKSENSIRKLKTSIIALLPSLEKPFYAFCTLFEQGVLFHTINKRIEFERELNTERFERKRDVVQQLQILNYDDPFNDNGALCPLAWLKGDIEKAILHNRSCLLKERDILLKRGFRKPDELRFYDG